MYKQDLEERILDNTKEPINMTKLHRKVHGDKQRCFQKTHEMVNRSQLRITNPGEKEIRVVRINTVEQDEFEFALTKLKELLESSREKISRLKKPLFSRYITTTTDTTLATAGGTVKHRYPTRKAETALKDASFQHEALLELISSVNLQRSLGMIREFVAETRIKKCVDELDLHFKKLISENHRDEDGIRLWISLKSHLFSQGYNWHE